jgi:hypothetical protein
MHQFYILVNSCTPLLGLRKVICPKPLVGKVFVLTV